MKNKLKEFFRHLIYFTGYELRNGQGRERDISTQFRPVGHMEFVIQDFKKRGLNCRCVLDVGANKGDWSRKIKLESLLKA